MSTPQQTVDPTLVVPEPGTIAERDAEAIRRARYEQILREHGAGLARTAGMYARTRADREDLVQEMALALWGALPRFRGDASLRTFAFRIASNCAITHLRRRRTIEPERDAVDESPSPEAALQHHDDRTRLAAAVARLPLSLRQVVTLKLEGLAYAEIAEIVGISEKNVSVRLTRARKALRDAMGGKR